MSTWNPISIARRLVPRLIILALPLSAGAARAQQPEVEVTGGRIEETSQYRWEIRHNHTSPLVHVEFEHYVTDTCEISEQRAPEEFTTLTTWKVNNTSRVGHGIITIDAESPADGVPRGVRRFITARVIANRDARPAMGMMRFRFADGAESVAQAILPSPPTAEDKFAPLIGLGSIFLLFILYRAVRRKPSPTETQPTPDR